MAVAGHNVREGVADADDGPGHVVIGEAVCLVKRTAGDETVREKCAGFEFFLHVNTPMNVIVENDRLLSKSKTYYSAFAMRWKEKSSEKDRNSQSFFR